MNANDVDMGKVNRLEVIDEDGRSYVNWQDHALGIEMSLQDEGRTIKVFTKGRSNVAAKDEQGKVLTDEEIERLAHECFGNMLNGIKHRPLADLEQKAAMSTISMYRTALRYARDNGYLAPAKGSSGLDVEGAIRTFKDTLKWGEYTGSMVLDWLLEDEPSMDGQDIEESLRKALEDLATNGKG